ncbi:MAG: hypothetical protein JSS86_15520, partial [Cyanobacteria bacterium SZAS LIN-2]|nr:hypothetical protein [Cyanobacteria bacterium SZAS LIN-2]
MAENPESLNALLRPPPGEDDAVEAMRRQIRVHEQTNQEKSALDKVVEVVWHKDDQTLADLKALQAKVDADLQRGNKSAVSGASAEIIAKTQADQAAMEGQNSVEFYSTSFLKAVPLFAGRSRVLMAASIGFNAMDAVKMKDNGGQVAADLALGGLKGFALKKTFDVLGSKQLSLGAEGSTLKSVSSVAGIGVKGIGIGGLSRLYDTGLNRQNWVNASGEVDPLNAVSMATRAALDGRSMALDATLFMGAHGVFSGLSKVGTRAIEASPALQRLESSAAGNFVKDAKLIPSATMGATFGFSSGAVGEVTREHQAGESFDLGKILKRGAYQALTDAAAGATGAGATRMTEIHGVNAAIAQAAKGRQMGTAFAGEDAPIVPEGKVPGEKVEVAQPPVVAEHPEVVKPEPGVQDHRMDAALQPIFEQSASLATRAVQPGAAAEDVVSFFKYTAGDGQHVRANMEDVARQAAQYGNTAMEALIKRAYEGTPEVAATLDTGLNLAQAASRHGASAEDHRAFLDYAYGQGKGAEVPLRIAAELTGDNAMDAMLQEAYAGANNLQRNPTGMVRISLNEMPPQAADVLKTILGHLPEDGLSHQLFRQNLHSWLDLVPQHADVVKQYAQQTRYGVIAAVVDAKLGTDYLSQFPERSLTNGNLLDKLRGVEHRASGDPADLEQVQPPQQVEQVEQPPAKPNPYEPAITHLPGEKVVNPERLIEEFYSSEGRGKQARAYLLTDFIREMNDQQFADWYAHGMQPSGRADGTTNFQLMRMPGLDVLERPEVLAAVTDPSHSIVDLKTLKEFLSAPVKSADMPPAWQTDFIADRVELATQRLAMTAPPQVEGEAPQPIDPNKIVKEAVPSWFLKGLRERYSTYDRNAGTATYPMEFDDNLAQMLENQRYLERQNPKYRESTPPSNSFADRIATLEKALDVQKT